MRRATRGYIRDCPAEGINIAQVGDVGRVYCVSARCDSVEFCGCAEIAEAFHLAFRNSCSFGSGLSVGALAGQPTLKGHYRGNA